MIFESDHSQITKLMNVDRTCTSDCVVAQMAILIQCVVVAVNLGLVLKVVFSSGLLLVFDCVYHSVST